MSPTNPAAAPEPAAESARRARIVLTRQPEWAGDLPIVAGSPCARLTNNWADIAAIHSLLLTENVFLGPVESIDAALVTAGVVPVTNIGEIVAYGTRSSRMPDRPDMPALEVRNADAVIDALLAHRALTPYPDAPQYAPAAADVLAGNIMAEDIRDPYDCYARVDPDRYHAAMIAYRERLPQTDGPERGTILRSANTDPELRAPITLFKPSGKYYTTETWRIPVGAIGPHDMTESPDFRRIDGGPVLVQSEISAGSGQEGAAAWGFDALLLP